MYSKTVIMKLPRLRAKKIELKDINSAYLSLKMSIVT